MGGLEAEVENSVPIGEHKVRRKNEVETIPPNYFHSRLCEAILCTNAGYI